MVELIGFLFNSRLRNIRFVRKIVLDNPYMSFSGMTHLPTYRYRKTLDFHIESQNIYFDILKINDKKINYV